MKKLIMAVCLLVVGSALFAYDWVGIIYRLTGKTDQGFTLTLDNGSIWSICHGDDKYTKDWTLGIEVVVVKMNNDATCGYQLLANHEVADATYAGQR